MKKQLLPILLALCMALALLPGAARAADVSYPVTGGNIYFDLTTGTVTDCDEKVTKADIPSEIYGVPVTTIGNSAFSHCNSLTSVTIPGTLTSIGIRAFDNCSSLASVTIPSGVASIGNCAFQECSSLTSVTIPDGVTSIEGSTFSGCSSLTSVTIPDSVTILDDFAFNNCSSLVSVTIPDSVTSLGGYAFGFCSSLTNMIIPNSVTEIGPYAFVGCSSLVNVTIPDSVTTFNQHVFTNCTSLTNVTLPGSATLTEPLFDGCSNLTSVIILDGVTSIRHTFSGCSSLTSVFIPSSVTTIRLNTFYDCVSLTDVYYGGSVYDWAAISVESGNDPLIKANIHYNSVVPSAPNAPSTPAPTIPAQTTNAVLSPQKLTVNGASVECEKYNIGGSNYFKLRDLAYVLNGTVSQFEVGFDAASSTVSITTGVDYTPNGSELAAGVDNASTAQPSRQTILIDGVERGDLTAYNIGGSNFFQLRELGTALGFDVDFDAASNTAIVRSTQE